MNSVKKDQGYHRGLLQAGMVLFGVGLATGFIIPLMENPRMGLSSHLEGILNGLFLIALGVLWPMLTLSRFAQRLLLGLTLFGTFANWLATLMAGLWGAGHAMPIAGGGHEGSVVQEFVITGLLMSLSAAMLVVCVMVLWGLRIKNQEGPELEAPQRA